MFVLRLICLLSLAATCGPARAEQMEDLAKIHTQAVGGQSRLSDLKALRARGRVVAAGQALEFELIAQRPNRVRVTMRSGGRTLVQGSDGTGTPWSWELGKSPAARMGAAEGRAFAADAEFDDPLVSAPDRGYHLDFAGKIHWREQEVFKVLVTRHDAAPVHLLIDPATFFIVARLTTRQLASGREASEEIRYDQFRPVAGVILPHRIETHVDGQLIREMVLTSVQAITPPPSETFEMPQVQR